MLSSRAPRLGVLAVGFSTDVDGAMGGGGGGGGPGGTGGPGGATGVDAVFVDSEFLVSVGLTDTFRFKFDSDVFFLLLLATEMLEDLRLIVLGFSFDLPVR